MPTLTIKLPSQRAQTEFNLHRWEELIADPEMAKIEGRVEMDRFGRAVLHPLASASHGGYQAELGCLLQALLPEGQVLI